MEPVPQQYQQTKNHWNQWLQYWEPSFSFSQQN
jgi:hypothetical protein